MMEKYKGKKYKGKFTPDHKYSIEVLQEAICNGTSNCGGIDCDEGWDSRFISER